MAQKSIKKPAVKSAATKKAPAKKTVAAKKPSVKSVKKTTAPDIKVVSAPVVETHECGCGHDCACGGKCGCRGGSKFGRFMRKLILFLIVFALGFAAAKMCCCGPRHFGPRVHFTNGCLDVASVKCPKLAAALPAMDINQDGCITRDEFRAVKQQMRAEIREMQVDIAE